MTLSEFNKAEMQKSDNKFYYRCHYPYCCTASTLWVPGNIKRNAPTIV